MAAWSRRSIPMRCARRSASWQTTALRRSRRSEEHTSELQSPCNVVCRLLPEKKNALHDLVVRAENKSSRNTTVFPHPLFYFQNKHSSQQPFLRFYDKRIRPAAGVLDNKRSSFP